MSPSPYSAQASTSKPNGESEQRQVGLDEPSADETEGPLTLSKAVHSPVAKPFDFGHSISPPTNTSTARHGITPNRPSKASESLLTPESDHIHSDSMDHADYSVALPARPPSEGSKDVGLSGGYDSTSGSETMRAEPPKKSKPVPASRRKTAAATRSPLLVPPKRTVGTDAAARMGADEASEMMVRRSKRKQGDTRVPVIREVVRAGDDGGNSSRTKGKRSSASHRRKAPSRIAKPGGERLQRNIVQTTDDDEEDGERTLMDHEGIVRDPRSGSDVIRPLAVTMAMVKPKQVHNHDYLFQKVFSEEDFMSSGIMVLPPGVEKPNRNSGESAMVFFVVNGHCQVTVHRTTFAVPTGSQFFIPRGNQYRLVNTSDQSEARLFFAQAACRL